jgi:hypothetical protein
MTDQAATSSDAMALVPTTRSFPDKFSDMDEWSQLGLDLGERTVLEAEVLMWRLWSAASH